jgi:hypothetical protein
MKRTFLLLMFSLPFYSPVVIAWNFPDWMERGAIQGGRMAVGFVFLAVIVGLIYLISRLLKRFSSNASKASVSDIFGIGMMIFGAFYCVCVFGVSVWFLSMGVIEVLGRGRPSLYGFFFVFTVLGFASCYWTFPALADTYHWVIEKFKKRNP